jgi:hypothetical protein
MLRSRSELLKDQSSNVTAETASNVFVEAGLYSSKHLHIAYINRLSTLGSSCDKTSQEERQGWRAGINRHDIPSAAFPGSILLSHIWLFLKSKIWDVKAWGGSFAPGEAHPSPENMLMNEQTVLLFFREQNKIHGLWGGMIKRKSRSWNTMIHSIVDHWYASLIVIPFVMNSILLNTIHEEAISKSFRSLKHLNSVHFPSYKHEADPPGQQE